MFMFSRISCTHSTLPSVDRKRGRQGGVLCAHVNKKSSLTHFTNVNLMATDSAVTVRAVNFSNEIVKMAKERGHSQVEFVTLLLQTCKHCGLVRFLSFDMIFGAKQ